MSNRLTRITQASVLTVATMALFSPIVRAQPWCETDQEAAAIGSDNIRVLSYNIHHGEGMDDSLDLNRIATLIREVNPDLVALQEIDSVAHRTNGIDQAAELGRLTGLNPAFGSFMSFQDGAYGMAILSRWPFTSVENVRLPEGEEPRTALAVTLELPESGARLRFVGVHLYRTAEERLAQATTLEEALGDESIPTILAGDFNSLPDSEVLVFLANTWTVLVKGEDRFTFPSYEPAREIDFVLLRPIERFEVLGQRLLDEPVASDHRPVVVDLILRN